ncbi:MAG: hypothetical protein JJT95_04620 [Pararhodobacter sp.]|nr:hypothetical protein [Pararhodobacter sp.]
MNNLATCFPIAESGAPPLPATIEASRVACIEGFAGLAEQAGCLRGALATATRQVSELSGMLHRLGVGIDTHTAITAACNDLGAALRGAGEALREQNVQQAMRTALEALAALERQARQLSAVSSITLVTARSAGTEGLDDYVLTLRRMIAELSDAAAQLDDGLGLIRSSHATVLEDISAAEARVVAAVGRLEALKRCDGADTADHAALQHRIAALAERLGAAARRETGALITAIQFSDALSQRLEHVMAILAAAPAQGRVLEGLAAAQIDALAEDAGAVLSELGGVMDRLAETGAGAAEALQSQEGMQAEALLSNRRNDLAEGQSLQALVMPSLDAAQAGADTIRQQIDQARTRYDRLSETADGVNLSAINATLLTARGRATQAAMAVLSESVRASARECDSQSAACRTAMEKLDGAVSEAGFPTLAQAAGALREALETCAAGLAAAEDDLARLADMREHVSDATLALVAGIEAGQTALARVSPAIARLRESAAGLGGGVQPGPEDATALAEMAEHYTMPREREVHAAFAGQPEEAPVTTRQELGDIFF